MLLTASSSLATPVRNYIAPRVTSSSIGWVLGGTSTLAGRVESDLESLLAAR